MLLGDDGLAAVVDQARWVNYDRHTRRVIVWRGGDKIEVVDADTGEHRETWPCPLPDPTSPNSLTVEYIAASIKERLDAGY